MDCDDIVKFCDQAAGHLLDIIEDAYFWASVP